MATISPDRVDQIQNKPVLTPPNDPKGFNPLYQQRLREQIIAENVGPLLSQCQALETIPPSEITTDEPPTRDTSGKKRDGVIITRIAPNLITSDGQRGGERSAIRRKNSA